MIKVFGLLLLAVLPAGVIVNCLRGRAVRIDKYNISGRPVRIYPDYSSTVIPPNIAPLNFMVEEEGSYYYSRIYSDKGEPIEVFSRSPKITIPIKPWKALLDKNKGGEVNFDIFVKTAYKGWVRFNTITNKIAEEDIDGYLVYRRMHPTHTLTSGHVGIYQRDMGGFGEVLLLDNRDRVKLCINCHTFCANRPDKMLMGVRSYLRGDKTVFVDGSEAIKLGAKFGYTAWHPSGKIAVYSINYLPMFFHTARNEVRDTFDMDSALAYYVVDSKKVKTSPEISKKDLLETWPAWSADGRYLYFCSTPRTWADHFPPAGYDKVKYDLVRISYDVERDKWGETETMLSSKDTGLSIAMPRTSPDGRWLLFCMSEYGYFPPWQQSSDLYLTDLKSGVETGRYEYHRLDISSDQSEGWHGWSSNSRWIVFSSKKEQGAFTRCYISYVDKGGRAYKPFVLPQKDPEFYNYCLEIFNTPEFITGPIAVKSWRLAWVANGAAEVSLEIPITMATPKAGVVQKEGLGWRRE